MNLCYVKVITQKTKQKGFPHGYYNTIYEVSSIINQLR